MTCGWCGSHSAVLPAAWTCGEGHARSARLCGGCLHRITEEFVTCAEGAHQVTEFMIRVRQGCYMSWDGRRWVREYFVTVP